MPELFGGAADLTSSTKTIFKDSPSFKVDPKGRNVFFGVREFGMMAAVNGMALARRPGSVRIHVLYVLPITAVRLCVWAGLMSLLTRCTSSRMTLLVSAKTAPRTSPSST